MLNIYYIHSFHVDFMMLWIWTVDPAPTDQFEQTMETNQTAGPIKMSWICFWICISYRIVGLMQQDIPVSYHHLAWQPGKNTSKTLHTRHLWKPMCSTSQPCWGDVRSPRRSCEVVEWDFFHRNWKVSGLKKTTRGGEMGKKSDWGFFWGGNTSFWGELPKNNVVHSN